MLAKKCLFIALLCPLFKITTVQAQPVIDTSSPIVITDAYSEKSSPYDGTFFGYTVSLFKNNFPQQSKGGNADASGWVFVGAPRGDYINGRYESDPPPTNEPGIVWRCSLGSSNDNCEALDLQNPFSQGSSACITSTYNNNKCTLSENQNGSWFGGSISISPSNSFATGTGGLVGCGFNWKRRYNSREDVDLVNGMCSWVPQASLLSSPTSMQPQRLIPLLDEGRKYYQVYVSGEKVNDYEYYYGQAGFSSHLTQDKLIIGAPGVHTWSGSVIYYERLIGGPPPSILRPNDQGINILDLVGYSVTSGNFYGSSEIIFAAGAPRAKDLLGNVLLLRRTYDSKQNIFLNVAQTVVGKQLGSYFGFTLCATDSDGDKVDELIVGVPFFSISENSNTLNEGDHGCIEIYSLKYRLESESICSKKARSRFGSAIASLGDINNDNYDDFAVGAPFEDENRGAVYIYLGRSGGFNKNNKEASQIITASDLYGISARKGNWLLGFGSSLHGGIDIDKNNTPDLAVGSYLSDNIVVFRTRPTVNIYVDILFQISGNKVSKFNRADKELTVKYCINFAIKPEKRGTKLKLWSRITVDKNYKRFKILPDDTGNRRSERNSDFTTEFSNDVTDRLCLFLKMRLEKEFEPEIPNSKLQIDIEAQTWYNETENWAQEVTHYDIKRASGGRSNPRLEKSGSKEFNHFCIYCPLRSESRTISDSLSIAQDDCNSNGNSDCESRLQFTKIALVGENEMKIGPKGQYPFEIGSSSSIFVRITVRNYGETAYSPIVELKALFSDEIRPVTKNMKGCYVIDDSSDMQQKILRCKLGLPLHHNQEMTEIMEIDVSLLYAKNDTDNLDFVVHAYPQDQKKISKSLSIELKAQAKVTLVGSNDVDRRVSISKDYTNIVHKYTVTLSGKSSIQSVRMKFNIPVNFTEKGKASKMLLAVSKPKSVMCTPIVGNFQELKVQSSATTTDITNGTAGILSRKRRDTTSYLTAKDTLAVACKENWECLTIECDTKLGARGSINVDFSMQMDNKVAKSLLKKEDKKIVVESEGYVEMLSGNTKEYKSTAHSYTHLIIVFVEDFPVWIAFVAGIGGLILLLLVTLGLAKCGFFRRETKEHLKALKSKTENDALLGENIAMQRAEDDDSED